MSRTITPEEQKRVQDVSELQNIKPTPKRTVFVDSDASGAPNVFIWNAGGDASLADGSEFVASTFSGFGDGEANEGIWQRLNLPFAGAATTDDLSEGSNNLYYTETRARNDFSASGDLTYNKNATGGFDLSTVSLIQSFDLSSQTGIPGVPTDVEFNNDGTKMFVSASQNKNRIFEYNLGTGFDVTTASFNNGFSISDAQGIEFNKDGTKIFVARSFGRVDEFNLGTQFDVSTINVNTSTQFDVTSEDGTPTGVTFNGDGSKMFVSGDSNANIYEYSLGTGFDLTTASFNQSFSVGSQGNLVEDVAFSESGNKMFVTLREVSSNIAQYNLTASFDISTATFEKGFDTSGEDNDPTGMAFNDDGTKMFVTGFTADDVFEYNIGVATAKLTLDVSSLSPSDLFGSKTTDDLPEGSSNLYFTGERSREAVDAALEGIGVDITYEESSQQNFGNPLIEIRGIGTNPNISDDGTQITQAASDINFGTGIGALNDNGTADIPFLDQFGEATFDGDGSSTQYSVQHGLTFEPESVQVQAITDDASSISHIDYDDTVITVIYDTPPPVGTDNLKIYYKLKVDLNQAPFWDNQGDLVFSFD
jgi:hypothetical protein